MGKLYRIDFGAKALVPVDDVLDKAIAGVAAMLAGEAPADATCQPRERIIPAYSDPNNEVRGRRFDKSLSTKEIAARVRAEIKASIRDGLLPGGLKVSVTFKSFSGGSSITIEIKECPFSAQSPEYLRFLRERPHDIPSYHGVERYTLEAKVLLATLEDILKSYHRDNSDSMSDYFDVNFYTHVRFDYDLEREERKLFEEIP